MNRRTYLKSIVAGQMESLSRSSIVLHQGLLGGGGLVGSARSVIDELPQIAQQREKRRGRRGMEQARGSEAGEIEWFDHSSFTATGNLLVQDQEVRILEKTILADVGYVYGFGEPVPGKEENQGTIYADPTHTGGTEADGWFRFRSENSQGLDTKEHGSIHTSRLRAPGLSTPSEWHKFPERNMPIRREDKVLYVTFEADNSADAGNALDDPFPLTMAMTEFVEGNR